MNTRIESLPVVYDEQRDGPFYDLTDGLFSPQFCQGARVLLASYDDVDATCADAAMTPTACQRS